MRTVQRKTHIIETSAAVGQNAVSVSTNPVLSQNVNVNINPNSKPLCGASEALESAIIAESTNVNPSPYSVIEPQNDPTLVSYKENDGLTEVY